MYNPIVSRLMKNRKDMNTMLSESHSLYEADEEEEDDIDSIDDDSTAPEQGTPDDDEDIDSENDNDYPAGYRSPLSSNASEYSSEEDDDNIDMEEEPEVPEESQEEPEVPENTYKNPLDNDYAIGFTLGSEVKLSHTGDTTSSMEGVVDGYDTEGFYRVKWSDGTTTNGLTDIALQDLVKRRTLESHCICGSSNIIKENNEIICDDCGRKINEKSLDVLTLADKSRPKGKRMIRSEAHPISTAHPSPSVSEAIKKAIKGMNLDEAEDIDDDIFGDLKSSLSGTFWTRKEEMREDIEDLGYEVLEMTEEALVISREDTDDSLYVPIGGTARTMILYFDRSRLL